MQIRKMYSSVIEGNMEALYKHCSTVVFLSLLSVVVKE